MTERINNVTYLPVAGVAEAETADAQPSAAHVEWEFSRTLEGAAALQSQSVGDVCMQLDNLVREPTVMTDSSPIIREQIGTLEGLFADMRTGVDRETSGVAIQVELAPGVRFDTQSGRLQFMTAAGVTPDDSVWQNSDQLDRQQINEAAITLGDRFGVDNSPTQMLKESVPREIMNQWLSGEKVIVSSNGEYQLVRTNENDQAVEVRVLDSDGTMISTSHYDIDRSHRYREFYDDGTIGLEISYDSDSVVRQVDYFDSRGSATTTEVYDRQGSLSHRNQLDTEGQIARTDYY